MRLPGTVHRTVLLQISSDAGGLDRMMRFKRGLVGRLVMVSSALALAGSAAGCKQQAKADSEEPRIAVTKQALVDDLAEQCGLDINCELGGVAEGRASISGIASVDSF